MPILERSGKLRSELEGHIAERARVVALLRIERLPFVQAIGSDTVIERELLRCGEARFGPAPSRFRELADGSTKGIDVSSVEGFSGKPDAAERHVSICRVDVARRCRCAVLLLRVVARCA